MVRSFLGWTEFSLTKCLGLNRKFLFRRCVQCEAANPDCPVCDSDQSCQLIIASCEQCARTECIKIGSSDPSATPNPSHKGGAPVTGAIAGGVVGGVAVIIIMTWLVWRFCIKKRRQDFEPSEKWRDSGVINEKGDFAQRRDPRASTHTVGSIASTVLTRASNIIQIAYIPGVTNRSIESSPDLLVPPVPPIPAAASLTNSSSSTPQPGQEQHFFMPSDLRDSRYSGYTDDNRSSYARSSLNPTARSSVAVTFRNNALVNPLPAQVVARGKANAVSVKSSGKNSPIDTPGAVTPPMPPIDYERHGQIPVKTGAPIVARIGVPKEVTVTKSSPPTTVTSKSPLSTSLDPSTASSPSLSQGSPAPLKVERPMSVQDPNRHNGDSSTFDDASTDDDESPPEQSLMGHRRLSSSRHSGFKSPQSAPDLRHSRYQSISSFSTESQNRLKEEAALNKSHKRSGSLNQIIEEATRRASREPRHGGLGSMAGGGGGGSAGVGSLASWKKDGPFSDAHAARTP